jgi:hypothetical protein
MGKVASGRETQRGERTTDKLMAVFIANYVKRGEGERKRAKATIRYIQNRKGKDGQRMQRTLFSPDGAMTRQEAYYWVIDEAEEGSYFYRFIISPDPEGEDVYKDLDMREITERTMLKLNERFNQPLLWVGVIHADHKPHRHVHLLTVVPSKLNVKDLANLRSEATAACIDQRLELDYALQQRERQRSQQEAQWELTL